MKSTARIGREHEDEPMRPTGPLRELEDRPYPSAATASRVEWKITRSDGGWHDILDTNSILCATAFGVGRARIVCAALAAENGEPVREQSDDDLCDPMFTEAMRSAD